MTRSHKVSGPHLQYTSVGVDSQLGDGVSTVRPACLAPGAGLDAGKEGLDQCIECGQGEAWLGEGGGQPGLGRVRAGAVEQIHSQVGSHVDDPGVRGEAGQQLLRHGPQSNIIRLHNFVHLLVVER